MNFNDLYNKIREIAERDDTKEAQQSNESRYSRADYNGEHDPDADELHGYARYRANGGKLSRSQYEFDLAQGVDDEPEEDDEETKEGMFDNKHSDTAQILAKLARVVKSVESPEQLRSAENFANLVFNKLNARIKQNQGFAGLGDSTRLMNQIEADLKAKAKELGTRATKDKISMDGDVRTMQKLAGVESVQEGKMAEVDQLLQDIADGTEDIYQVWSKPSTPIEQAASDEINKLYDEVVIDTGLHADDDVEQILDRVAGKLADRYAVDESEAHGDEDQRNAKSDDYWDRADRDIEQGKSGRFSQPSEPSDDELDQLKAALSAVDHLWGGKKKTQESVVAECGPMGMSMSSPAQQDSVTMNVSMNGSGAGGIRDLMKILSNIQSPDTDVDAGADIAVKVKKEPGFDFMSKEEYANSPDEQYGDMSDAIPSGNDLHKEKGAYPKAAGGDNPMALGIAKKLESMYEDIKKNS